MSTGIDTANFFSWFGKWIVVQCNLHSKSAQESSCFFWSMEASQIKPVEDNILIEPLERETTTASGIVIPDSVKEKPQQGKVLAVGPGKKDDEGRLITVDIKVGSVVLYKKWGGNEIKASGKEYLIIRSEDVLAVIE